MISTSALAESWADLRFWARLNPPCSVLALGVGLFFALAPVSLHAQNHHHSNSTSPYAGLDKRAITSLSEADIAELRRGGGWGLALVTLAFRAKHLCVIFISFHALDWWISHTE